MSNITCSPWYLIYSISMRFCWWQDEDAAILYFLSLLTFGNICQCSEKFWRRAWLITLWLDLVNQDARPTSWGLFWQRLRNLRCDILILDVWYVFNLYSEHVLIPIIVSSFDFCPYIHTSQSPQITKLHAFSPSLGTKITWFWNLLGLKNGDKD